MYGSNEYGSIPYGSDGGPYSINYTSTLEETATLSEPLFDWIAGKGREYLETITLSDTYTRAMTTIRTEVATLTEVYSSIYNRFVSFLDSLSGLTDSITSVYSRFYILLDTIDLTDIYSRSAGRLSTLTDDIILTEVFSEAYGRFRTVTDSFSGLTDSIIKATTRRVSDIYTITDSIRKYINGLLWNLWSKTVKTTATFTKTVKPSSPTYTKELKPNVQDIWTIEEKPY